MTFSRLSIAAVLFDSDSTVSMQYCCCVVPSVLRELATESCRCMRLLAAYPGRDMESGGIRSICRGRGGVGSGWLLAETLGLLLYLFSVSVGSGLSLRGDTVLVVDSYGGALGFCVGGESSVGTGYRSVGTVGA